jgi:cardiolipin synthase C
MGQLELPVGGGRAALLRRIAAMLALLWLAGCASLPTDVVRTPSSAIDEVGTTALARVAAASTPAQQRLLSGVRLLPDAQQAFDLRLALARAAQVSLDLQYYVVAGDSSGGQVLAELALAAQRGVRVRLLVDDLHAAETDDALRRLAALPHAEVRLFNPLPSRAGSSWTTRMLLSLHEFARVNRRMHNKLFVADNSFAVTGGRNIADEYFMRGETSNFIDMDLLASGPIVRELSGLFDRFWNSEHAYPIESLAPAGASPSAETAAAETRAPAPRGHGDALLHELRQGRIGMHFAPVQLIADGPGKAEATSAATAPTAMDQTLKLFAAATQEIDVVSPYFVPGARGMALIRTAAARGVALSVTTNSLASTDEPMAYLGYARYRGEMLDLGVSISELSPAGAPRLSLHSGLSASVGRLHAKVATVDRRWLLIGSMNMDVRSSRTNSELVLVIDSAELAAQMSELLHAHWRDDHYRLRRVQTSARRSAQPAGAVGAPRQTEWVRAGTGTPLIHRNEPGVNWLARLRLSLMSMFVPEEWL